MTDPQDAWPTRPATDPVVAAVVVTYNRSTLLPRVLEGVRQQSHPVQVVVVDNASTDGTASLLEAAYPDVRVVRLPTNTGCTGGVRAGVQAAQAHGATWVWIMDDDVVPRPDCLAQLLAAAQASGRRVVVPRRRMAGAVYPNGTGVFDEGQQRAWFVPPEATAPDGWLPIDLFTFEGPLVHRSVLAQVEMPEAGLFIGADDALFSARVYRTLGPGAAALALDAAVDRLLPLPEAERHPSRVKRLLTGRPDWVLVPDTEAWKAAYRYRNRHFVLRELGWTRQHLRYALLHLGFAAVDAFYAARRGGAWRLRLTAFLQAWLLGVLDVRTPFLDPASFHRALRRVHGG
ncbi:MAG: glycosyltransferase [Bacteroidota bacterium]